MIFIIGGRGFVGSAFARVCEAKGKEYVIITRQNYHEFIGKRCEIIIDANGNSKKFLAKEAPLEDFDASVRSVRSSLVNFKYDCYVYLSSCDVYPDCSSSSITSEDEKIDVSKQSPYGFHKYLAELCVQHAAKRWLIIRFGGFVGPGLKKNAIYDILNGGPLWLDPESELQYMHTDHAAEIVLKLLDLGITNEIFNICGRGVIKLQEVIKVVGGEIPVQPGSPRVRYEVNIDKISKLADISETRATVLEFVRAEMKRREEERKL
jgi:nucleoside-diphosphate-sugar epimerase